MNQVGIDWAPHLHIEEEAGRGFKNTGFGAPAVFVNATWRRVD